MRSDVSLRHRRFTRSAFTLIEMMVVLLIISILVGLLLGAITAVRRTMYISMTLMELDQIKQALTQYKTDYSAFPPSAGEWTTTTVTTSAATDWPSRMPRLQQHFRKMFPKLTDTFPVAGNTTIYARTFTAAGAPGTVALDVRNLDAAEAYLFFLNGPPIITAGASGTVFSFNGWATDPANPIDTKVEFAERTQRKPILFEASNTRLKDQDGDNWPEFYTYEQQRTPVVYFLGNQYTYTTPGAGGTTNTVAYQMAAELAGMARPYASRVITTLSSTATNTRDGWVNPDGIQLIVAGMDGLYGTVPETAPMGAPDPSSVNLVDGAARTFPIGVFGPSARYRSGELDNITNFHGTTIGSAD